MKSTLTVLVCICTLGLGANARAFDFADESARELSTYDRADLQRRLAFARLYLAELEGNDKVMSAIGVPSVKGPKRTAFAIGKTAAFTLAGWAGFRLLKPVFKQSVRAHELMKRGRVRQLRKNIPLLDKSIKLNEARVKVGAMPAGSVVNQGMIDAMKSQVAIERRQLAWWMEQAKVAPMRRLARGAAYAFGIGVAATLIKDGYVTWFQVLHNGEDVEQQKRDVRDFIAYAEHTLRGEVPASR